MKNYREKRKHERISHHADIDIIVLSTRAQEFERKRSSGTIIDSCASGVGMLTLVNLEPGDIVEWDDSQEKGKLHIAMVKWTRKEGKGNRVGLIVL